MADSEQMAAIAADQASREAFRAWQAEKDPEERVLKKITYENANLYAQTLWERVGPDPLLSQVGAAQAVTDAEEGHAQ